MRTGGGEGSATVTIVSFMPSVCAQAAATGQPAFGGRGSVDAGDEAVDAERWDCRLVGVRVDDEGAGDDDRVVAAFDDVACGRADHGACDSAPTVGRQADQAGVELRGAALNGASDVGVDLDVDAWVVRSGAE